MPTYKALAITQLTLMQMDKKLVEYAWDNGIYIVRRTCWRSNEEQKRLFLLGASKVEENGRHFYALANDYVMFDNVINYKEVVDSNDARWKLLGEFWKGLGGVWGGDWGWDAGHFEFWPFNSNDKEVA